MQQAGPVTQDRLLGGRVLYYQPAQGFRAGIEPVLLAASIDVRPGERVLEGGTGAGAALLCLASRVPGVEGVGIDQDAALVQLASGNAAANGTTGLTFQAADIARLPELGRFDHACANPPYHAATGTPSPLAPRARAKQADDGLLAVWARALAAPLRHRGTLTLILPAAALPQCVAAMVEAACMPDAVLPLWPKQGRPARLMLVRGIKGGRAPLRLLSGLLLHQNDGTFTAAADAVLRDAMPLPME